MPEQAASEHLAEGLGSTAAEATKQLRRFRAAKDAYKLKSHRPSLIHHIEPNGDLKLTLEGQRLLRSMIPSK
jgi:hypothetical protein